MADPGRKEPDFDVQGKRDHAPGLGRYVKPVCQQYVAIPSQYLQCCSYECCQITTHLPEIA